MSRARPNAIRAEMRRLLRRTGFDIVKYPLHSTREGHVKWLLDSCRVKTVIDVGANVGQFAKKVRAESRFKGHIVSFEPDPDTVRTLTRAAANDPNWSVLAYALGDKEGTAQLRRFAESDWNSLHEIDDDLLARSGRTVERRGTIPCAVRRLDSLWDEVVQGRDPVFLKSDTQGHDLAVIAGAGERLSRVTGMMLEASVNPMYDGEADLREVLKATRQYGFQPSGFFPVVRTRGSLALDVIDLCLVRAASTAPAESV